MGKQKFKKIIPFFRIYNGLSDSASFRTRLFLAFILIAVPILAGSGVASFLVLRTSAQENIKQSQATALAQLNTQLMYIVNDTENVSREMVVNTSIQQLLTEHYQGEQYPEDSSVTYYINNFTANRDFIDCIVLTGQENTVFSTERAYTEVSAFYNIQKKWWYPDLISSNNSFDWYPNADNENALMLARPIYSLSDYQTLLGYMMIYLDPSYINNIWDSNSWGKTTNIFLLDENNQILAKNISEQDYSGILSTLPSQIGTDIQSWNHKNYVVSCSDITTDNWKLCMITPYQEVDNSVMILKTELTVMFAVIILILFLMSKYSANNMAQPIILLSQMMDAYHGKEQASLPVSPALYEKRTDEIGQMYRSYKQMMERIETLTQEIYIKNLEKKDAELALLQSQINPHFLYNTLDSINWLALANDQDEISEMITALSDTFRLSLMKSNSSFVEIEHEIQYIKSYLILQEFRYGKRLKYAFALPDPLPKLLIPRFILQPVVENALKHGIDSLEKGGHICIKLTCSTQLIITVINDGTAINLEQMNALLRFDPKGPDILSFQKGGYGVQNIHRRIKIICGDEYGLSYETTDTQTICKITLPRKEQEEISSL